MTYHDPITGDELKPLEFYTRQVQVVVRTPWFLLAFNLITIICIILGQMLAWNDLASWLAIMIEWLVGCYMFGQTGRDAVYIRKIARLEEVNDRQLKHLETLIARQTPGSDLTSDGQDSLHREVAEASERRSDPPASDPG
jgi:hypothetical protein